MIVLNWKEIQKIVRLLGGKRQAGRPSYLTMFILILRESTTQWRAPSTVIRANFNDYLSQRFNDARFL